MIVDKGISYLEYFADVPAAARAPTQLTDMAVLPAWALAMPKVPEWQLVQFADWGWLNG